VEYSEGGKDSTVTIDCFDALGLLANETIPEDWLDTYTRSLNPLYYWKCNDSRGTKKLKDVIAGFDLSNANPVQPDFSEQQPLADGLLGSSAVVNQYWTNAATIYGPPYTIADFAISAWVQFLPGVSDNSALTFDYGNVQLEIVLRSGTSISFSPYSVQIYVYTNAWGFQYLLTPTFTKEVPHHLVVSVDTVGQTITCVVDGRQVSVTRSTIASRSLTNNNDLFVNFCNIQEVAMFPRQLTLAEAINLFNYGSGRIEESTLARFGRVLNTTEIPSSMLSLSALATTTVAEIGSGTGVVAETQSVTKAENGELYVSSSGVLTFVDRYGWANRSRSNTSQVTFTDTGTGVYYDAGAVRMDLNADQVRNDVNVTFSGGGSVVSRDQSSIDEFGAASESVSTYIANPTEAQTLADYVTDIYGQPKIRVEPFLVKGQRNPSYDWPRLLALELLDRFTFVRTPSVGSAISKPMLLQSIEHRFTPGTWETIINGSARYTGWFVLDSSLLDGEDVLL